MKYEFDFSHMPAFVLINTGEFAVVEDFYKLLKDLISSPKWIPGTSLLVDHRNVARKKISPDDISMIRSIFEFHLARLGGGKCAVIVAKDILPANDNLAVCDTSLPTIEFFFDPVAARKWLTAQQ